MYGEMAITSADVAEFVKNFKDKVRLVSTLASRLSPLGLLPWHQNDWFLQFRAKACIRFTPPLRRSPPTQSSGTWQTYPRRTLRSWF